MRHDAPFQAPDPARVGGALVTFGEVAYEFFANQRDGVLKVAITP